MFLFVVPVKPHFMGKSGIKPLQNEVRIWDKRRTR